MKEKLQYGIGAILVAIVLSLSLTVAGKTAVSELAGLAVAQSATVWKNVRDAAVGDNLTDGILATALMLFDGTNFDRARGDTTNGLDVDVTRIQGGITPSDAFGNPTDALKVFSLSGIFNGSTWDRWRGQTVPVQGITLLNAVVTSAADSVSTITLTGVASTRIHLYKLISRCAPAGTSSLLIADGVTSVYSTFVPGTNQQLMEQWAPGLTVTTGANLVITVQTCGSGNTSTTSYQADQF